MCLDKICNNVSILKKKTIFLITTYVNYYALFLIYLLIARDQTLRNGDVRHYFVCSGASHPKIVSIIT